MAQEDHVQTEDFALGMSRSLGLLTAVTKSQM